MLLAIGVAALIASISRFDVAHRLGNHGALVQDSADDLIRSVVYTNSGVLAYLLTGHQHELGPVSKGRAAFAVHARRFVDVLEDTRHAAAARRLVRLGRDYESVFAARLIARRARGPIPVAQLDAAVAAGARRVEAVRDLGDAVETAAHGDDVAGIIAAERSAGHLRTAGIVALCAALLLLLAFGVLLNRGMLMPLGRLRSVAERISRGEFDARVDGQVSPEVGDVAEAFAGVAERGRELFATLEGSRLEVLKRLALAAEFRDDDTHEHTERVGEMAAAVGAQLALSDDVVAMLRGAAPLHDIGKIGVPDSILLKAGPLTDDERVQMQRHARMGADLLAGGGSPMMQMAEEIARSHHERWDGGGYPSGLAGPAIPLAARIVAVADVFDALTHERPYKHAWPADRAIAEIRDQAGRQFDPTVVDAFLAVQSHRAGRLA